MRHPPPQGPACLVLDMRMPGMSGLELQQELVAAGLGLPVIFLTGHGTVPMSVRALKTGAADFLQKPVEDQVLWTRFTRPSNGIDRRGYRRPNRCACDAGPTP